MATILNLVIAPMVKLPGRLIVPEYMPLVNALLAEASSVDSKIPLLL
jgi:hypothetical protein